MSLSGDLSTMPLPDLLQWLAAARKTGVATFARGDTIKTVCLSEGWVAGSSSNDPTDMVGQWLVASGRITEDQLRIALGEQERSHAFLGTILVQMKALSEQEVSAVLALKTEEIIYSLFHWDAGTFEFQEGPYSPLPFRINLAVQEVLLKGVRRFDEMQRITSIFGGSSVVLRRTGLAPPENLTSHAHARTVLESVNGVRSIADIALHTHASEFAVGRFLLMLHQGGYVEIVQPAGGPPRVPAPAQQADSAPWHPAAAAPSTNGFSQAALALIEAGDFEGAITMLSQFNRRDPHVQNLIARAEGGILKKLYAIIPQERVPILARSMDDLKSESLSAEEVYLLSRIDGEWDVRSIVSIAPLREVEALRLLARLRERGFISLE